jgi:prepilin-type N-terminal cleavage/methylation domain-containing protein
LRSDARREDGFTLLEVLVAMVLFGIMVTLAAGPYASYRAKQEHIGSARELVGFLRRAQVRAVSEETTYRVDLLAGGTGVRVYRLTNGSYVAKQSLKPASTKITYTGAAFVQPSGGNGTSIWFYPRGSGSKGSLVVSRAGTSTTYTVDVEGLTARVSYE